MLCVEMNLTCEVVTGYANPAIASGTHQATGHAWNAVMIDKTWRLLDVTWASEGNGRIADGFFMVPPELFIYSHFPSLSAWQCLGENVWSRNRFDNLPSISPHFLKLGLRLDSHQLWWFEPEAVAERTAREKRIQSNPSRSGASEYVPFQEP